MRNNFKGKPQTVDARQTPTRKHLSNRLRCFLSCLSLIIAISAGFSTAHAVVTTGPSYTAVFVTDPTRPIPTQEFDCSQNIYLYFTWWGLKDLHQITVLWVNPKGKQQDDIDLKFVATTEKVENWVGL